MRSCCEARVVVLVTVGLSAMPYAGASQNNCPASFFPIAESELLADERPLEDGNDEWGGVEVSAIEGDRELNVELTGPGNGGELTWLVYITDDGCTSQYTANDCDEENILDAADDEASCTLEAPVSGSTDFRVHFDATGDDDIMY